MSSTVGSLTRTERSGLCVVSYGGGVQSTALLVLAAQGYIPHRIFLFANVGDDSEHPDTLRYVRDIAFDYAAANGIEMHELERQPTTRGLSAGEPRTVYSRTMDERYAPAPVIPMRMPNGAPVDRICTSDWKIEVVSAWLTEHGASPENKARVAIGISVDEIERAKDRRKPSEVVEYPLLTLEHRLAPRGATRNDCERIIRDAGLPVPRKSSCYFCPFHSAGTWTDQRRTEPVLFEQSCQLEESVNRRRAERDMHPVYLSKFGRPLRDVFANAQGALFENDQDDGYRCGDVCDT